MRNLIYLVLFFCFSHNSVAYEFIDNHRLIFLFSSHCPHCHNQAPILKAFSDENHFEVDAYSLDNQGIEEYPDVQMPTQELLTVAFADQSIKTPAIFILNTESFALYPVSIGEVGFDELQSRMLALSAKVLAFENGGV